MLARVFMRLLLLIVVIWPWWLNSRLRQVRLLIAGEGCASVEESGLTVVSAREDGGCIVRAELLPANVLDPLASPPQGSYRFR